MVFSKYAMTSEVVCQPHACLCSTSDQDAVKPGKVSSIFSKLTGLPQTALL